MMRVVAAVLLAALGLALTAQVQTRSEDASLSGYREQDLLSLVTALGGSTARAQQDLAELRRSQDDLQAELDAATDDLEEAREVTGPMTVLAGGAPASGPGLVARIKDPRGAVGSELLLDLVEDLRGAGAEAIEINGEVRVGADTWFAGEGGAVQVDGVALARPYVVEVVGRVSPLEGAMVFPTGGADRMRQEGAVIETSTPEVVEVGTTRPLPPVEGAEPVGPVL